MGSVTKIKDCVIDIGVNAVKDKIKSAQEESEIRHRLNDFLDRQQKYNLNCTLDEEIDFQGIAEYICGDLLEDIKKHLSGNIIERRLARQSIMDKAVYYAQAETCISAKHARQLVSTAIDILRSYYRKKVNRELKFIATEIEDAVIDEMTTQHQSLEKKIEETSALSIDRNIALIQDGNVDLVERNLSTFIKGISTVHTLPHDFKFGLNERGRMISIPINDNAIKCYPPRFMVSAKSVKMGNATLTNLIIKCFREHIVIRSQFRLMSLRPRNILGIFWTQPKQKLKTW